MNTLLVLNDMKAIKKHTYLLTRLLTYIILCNVLFSNCFKLCPHHSDVEENVGSERIACGICNSVDAESNSKIKDGKRKRNFKKGRKSEDRKDFHTELSITISESTSYISPVKKKLKKSENKKESELTTVKKRKINKKLKKPKEIKHIELKTKTLSLSSEKLCKKDHTTTFRRTVEEVSKDSPGESNKKLKKIKKTSSVTSSKCLPLTTEEDTIISITAQQPIIYIPPIPFELWEHIISYVTVSDIISIRQIDAFFYKLTTGYDKIGVVGTGNKPSRRVYLAGDLKILDAKKWPTDKLLTIPSFLFYQSAREIRNWPLSHINLAETKITKMDLDCKEDFSNLKNNLTNNNLSVIKVKGVEMNYQKLLNLLQILEGSSVRSLVLDDLKITDACIEKISKKIPQLGFTEIHLEWNELGSSGIALLLECFKINKKLKGLYLGCNSLGNEGVSNIGKVLDQTTIKYLHLGANGIGNMGLINLIKNIKKSKLEELYLGDNQIEDLGANEIGVQSGGSELRLVDLRGNGVTKQTQDFLITKYSEITWKFEVADY